MIQPVHGAVAFQIPSNDVAQPFELTLLPQRAVWLESVRTLLVADVHLGKALTFRRLGTPVPRGTTTANLDRLSQLIERLSPTRLVVLGDFLHSRFAHSATTHEALKGWRTRWPELELVLVRGNHDDKAGDPPAWLGMRCVDEPWRLEGTPLALCHHPQDVPGAYALAGHVHPSVSVGTRWERLRLPCFHSSPTRMVLPAFGEFTGTHPVRCCDGEQVHAVAEGLVMRV
jgi:uncharacterized protein